MVDAPTDLNGIGGPQWLCSATQIAVEHIRGAQVGSCSYISCICRYTYKRRVPKRDRVIAPNIESIGYCAIIQRFEAGLWRDKNGAIGVCLREVEAGGSAWGLPNVGRDVRSVGFVCTILHQKTPRICIYYYKVGNRHATRVWA